MTINEPVDPITTTPDTQPTIPTIADLLPAKARAWVYALLGVWLPVYGIWTAQSDGGPPEWVSLVTAGLGASGFLLSTANVPRRTT